MYSPQNLAVQDVSFFLLKQTNKLKKVCDNQNLRMREIQVQRETRKLQLGAYNCF